MRQAELAARWAARVWRGATLQTLSGATYRLIYEGRRNGGPGPAFRDAALETEDGQRLLGDIELHLRARDWLAHDRAVAAVTRRAHGGTSGGHRGAARPRRRDLLIARSQHGGECRLPFRGGARRRGWAMHRLPSAPAQRI
jgi:hypothetical protein